MYGIAAKEICISVFGYTSTNVPPIPSFSKRLMLESISPRTLKCHLANIHSTLICTYEIKS